MTELVGQGKPFYSALDMGAKALKRKVGTGSEFLKELMALPGVKPTELKERGLEHLMNEPKMTHEQFLNHLVRKSAPKIKEKVLSSDTNEKEIDYLIKQDVRDKVEDALGKRGRHNAMEYDEMFQDLVDEAYKFDWNNYRDEIRNRIKTGEIEPEAAHNDPDLLLPGGQNYREMLIKHPNSKFVPSEYHFNKEPGVLASMRLTDRLGPNGEKLLHLEELQSDWHQKGREHGYQEPSKPVEKTESNPFGFNRIYDEEVPDAPFKKNWEEMAIKRLIHHAAEKGYHGIVMTPGQENADRYSLAQHIDALHYNPETHRLMGKKNVRVLIDEYSVPPEKLESLVGKDAAQKVMSQKPNVNGLRSIIGEDLQVGGEGMKGFYDKKVPNIFNAVGKKHGVKMQLHGHQIETKPSSGYQVRNTLEQNSRPTRFMHATDAANWRRANNLPDTHVIEPQPAEHTQLHHFPITEPMREDVLKNGLPLYNTGGVIHKAEGGNVQPSIEQMRMALNQNRYVVPKADIQSIGANEAPSMQSKVYINPGQDGNPPVGGVDMNAIQPGMQMMKPDQPAMTPPGGQQAPSGNASNPLGGAPTSPLGGAPSNILQMTPQGQALGAMSPPQQLQPQTQGLAKGGQPKGYLKSTPMKPHPLVGTRHKATPQGNLAQRLAFDLFKHEGKGSIVPVPYDATSRDNLVTNVSGHRLKKPLLTEAGFDYSMDPSHIAQQIGGASGLQIAGRVQDRINQASNEHGENVFLLPNTMGENAENFSHHPAHIILDLMRQRKLEPHILDALTHDLRSQHELVEDKDTKKKYRVYPYQNFVGFGHPKMEEQIMRGGHGLETSAGNLRKKLMDRLGGVNMQKLLDYTLADLKGAILDPDLATDPKGYMGRTVVKAQPGAPLRLSKHGSYDTDYAGEYQGSMHNRPIELLMPDVYNNIYTELTGLKKNEGKTEPQLRAQVVGAIEKRKQGIAQPINARVINNAGLYEQGLKQGEFDPKNLDSVLAYYKRKGGFKKGGKVEASMDTMRYALSKQKKAK